MSTSTVRAEWVRDRLFVLADRSDFPIVMTQPQGVNGADLLPLSLIGCAGWDVAAILRKQRQALTGLEITAECEQDPEPPWRYRRIHIHYRCTGHNLDAGHVRRAIELSETRYCSIYATLRDAVAIDSDFEIVSA